MPMDLMLLFLAFHALWTKEKGNFVEKGNFPYS